MKIITLLGLLLSISSSAMALSMDETNPFLKFMGPYDVVAQSSCHQEGKKVACPPAKRLEIHGHFEQTCIVEIGPNFKKENCFKPERKDASNYSWYFMATGHKSAVWTSHSTDGKLSTHTTFSTFTGGDQDQTQFFDIESITFDSHDNIASEHSRHYQIKWHCANFLCIGW